MIQTRLALVSRLVRPTILRATFLAVTFALLLGADIGILRAQTAIEVDTTSLDFGVINVGNSSAGMAITLTNTDPVNSFGPFNAVGGEPSSAEFSASQNCVGVTLPPGGTCNFTYTFSPSAPVVFNDTSNFTVSEASNPADVEAFSISLTGEGTNPITAAPLSHDFGDVGIGTTGGPLATVITNTSADSFGPLNGIGGEPPSAEFSGSQNCVGVTLLPGGTCTFTFTFTPSGLGAVNDTSSFFIGAAPDQGGLEHIVVTLTGKGVIPVTAAPLSHDFGEFTVGTTSAPLATVISNVGGAPVGPLTFIGGEPPSVEFSSSQDCQGATLAPGGTCSVSYTFSPSAKGNFSDTSNFTISPTASAEDGVAFAVELSGVGVVPRATFLVEKDFTDDNPAEVVVMLSCNTGLPLEQTTSIAEGDPVNFVIVDYEPGTLDCEVTEVVPDGYTSSYDDGTTQSPDGCRFADVTDGQFACTIINALDPVEVEVTKTWIDDNPQFNGLNVADANWSCSNVASGDSSGSLSFFGNSDTQSFQIFPSWNGGTDCEVSEVNIPDGGVEIDDSDCQSILVFPGGSGACEILNTRLYEGIPALNTYGRVLLALLFALMGWVAFRRYS